MYKFLDVALSHGFFVCFSGVISNKKDELRAILDQFNVQVTDIFYHY